MPSEVITFVIGFFVGGLVAAGIIIAAIVTSDDK